MIVNLIISCSVAMVWRKRQLVTREIGLILVDVFRFVFCVGFLVFKLDLIDQICELAIMCLLKLTG